jgi:acyl-homoserine-lactone acylase
LTTPKHDTLKISKNSIPTFHLSFLIVLLIFQTFSSQNLYGQSLLGFETIDPDKITIIRDKWGVPHIHGPTDAHAAYGLAWANSEDAFPIMQETLLTGKGMMGRHLGKEGAIRDYLLHALDIPGAVNKHFEDGFSQEYLRYIDGYTQGLNDFAASHPDQIILHGTFPVTPQEVVQGLIFISNYITYAPAEIQRILEGEFELDQSDAVGSNAYAFSSALTKDGKTMLAINPHQPMEGPFSFYEAHLLSDEGLNIHGAMFQGSTSIGLGNNENIGWAMTYNGLDLVDSYILEMHPSKKLQYLYDGEYKKLQKKTLWISVKVHKMLTIQVPKTIYWSTYGPTFKKHGKFYSIRVGANQNVSAPEQLYLMNKAGNLEEFKAAMKLRGVPRFNIVYADRFDNIYFVCNGQIPERASGYDWENCVPGNTSETKWTSYIPYDSLPQMLNPASGFLYNTNNTPFHCTGSADNPDPSNLIRYPAEAGYKKYDNNRSLRFMELVRSKEEFAYSDFKAIKFDKQFPENSAFLASCEGIFNLDTALYPHLSKSVNLLSNWDRKADGDSPEATLFALTIDNLFHSEGFGQDQFFAGFEAPVSSMVTAMEDAESHLMRYFEKIEVPLAEFQRILRGDFDLPLPGYFDMLAANYSQVRDDGRYEVFIGDSYTQFVIFGQDGVERLETLQPFGASTREESTHYTDQMELFVNHKTKKMSMDWNEIKQDAVSVYSPGMLIKEHSVGRH